MIRNRFFLCSAVLATLIAGCHSDGGPPGNPAPARTYHMGFQPWPYDVTQASVDQTWQYIYSNADMISQHFEEGVPWVEAYAGSPFPTGYQQELQDRLNRTPATHKIFLEINALDSSRVGMAPERTDQINQPLPAPWNTYALNSPQVKTAYLNYATRMVQFFNPAVVNIGIECNELMRNTPAVWPQYLELLSSTYAGLKAQFPSLPVIVSVSAVNMFQWLSGATNTVYQGQLQALQDVQPYTDYLGLSFYPFMGTYLAEWDSLIAAHPDFFDQLFTLANKPVAVTESGFPAVSVTMGSPPATFNGSPARQNDVVARMLAAADKYSAKFVIWFLPRDYYQMWQYYNGINPTLAGQMLTWRDDGMYDPNGNARPSLSAWRNRLAGPYSGKP
jgi:hypothetical protein